MGRKSTVQVDEAKVLELYKSGLGSPAIAKHFDRAKPHHIDWVLKKNGIEKRTNKENSRKYEVDHHFFDVIDTEEKAYWLGFLAADGYVTTKGNYVGLSLDVKDGDHLEKFAKAIGSTYPIATYQATGYGKGEYCRLIISSDQMRNSLIKHGIVEHKSLVLQYPNLVPYNLEHHFIRGYFDGDGSLAKNGNGGYQIKICGTKDMLCMIQYALNPRSKALYKRRDDDKDNWYISIGGRNQVRRIMDDLYYDATVYLERKYLRYQGL